MDYSPASMYGNNGWQQQPQAQQSQSLSNNYQQSNQDNNWNMPTSNAYQSTSQLYNNMSNQLGINYSPTNNMSSYSNYEPSTFSNYSPETSTSNYSNFEPSTFSNYSPSTSSYSNYEPNTNYSPSTSSYMNYSPSTSSVYSPTTIYSPTTTNSNSASDGTGNIINYGTIYNITGNDDNVNTGSGTLNYNSGSSEPMAYFVPETSIANASATAYTGATAVAGGEAGVPVEGYSSYGGAFAEP